MDEGRAIELVRGFNQRNPLRIDAQEVYGFVADNSLRYARTGNYKRHGRVVNSERCFSPMPFLSKVIPVIGKADDGAIRERAVFDRIQDSSQLEVHG